MRCSQDLRKRVIDFVRGGGSKTEAARRFQVSRASVYNWTRVPDGLAYQRPGPKGPRRLDWEALRTHVKQGPDRTHKERAQHFGVSRHCIWQAWQQMELSRKKKSRIPRT
jgi:transposase